MTMALLRNYYKSSKYRSYLVVRMHVYDKHDSTTLQFSGNTLVEKPVVKSCRFKMCPAFTCVAAVVVQCTITALVLCFQLSVLHIMLLLPCVRILADYSLTTACDI